MWGFEDCEDVLDWGWLNSTRDDSNWIYMGGQGPCNNYKVHLVFA